MSCGDVSPGWGTNNKGTQDDGLDPDVTMMGVARHKDRFFSHSLFYEQARDGTLRLDARGGGGGIGLRSHRLNRLARRRERRAAN